MTTNNTQHAHASQTGAGMDRRAFLKLSGLATMTMGSMAFLAGCGPAAQGTSSSTPAVTTAAASAGTFAADGTLRVGMEAAYAPYNWQVTASSDTTIPIENVSGAYADGYDVQIAKKVAEGLGLTPVAVKLEWDGLIEALGKGQIDVIIAGMTATPERAESIDFTEPYYIGTYGLMVKGDSSFANATSIQDFSGAAVLGQKDTLLATVIDELKGLVFEEGKGFSETVPVNIGISKGQDDTVKKMNDILAGITESDRQKIWEAAVARQPE